MACRTRDFLGEPEPRKRFALCALFLGGRRPEGEAPPPSAHEACVVARMIRKLTSGKYRLYSRKKDRKTGKRKNLGTFASRAAAEKHERAVQYFKHP